MSLDETARQVWNTKETPLATFVAGRLTQMAAVDLPPAVRDTFATVCTAVESWWPNRVRLGNDLPRDEFAACLGAYSQEESADKIELAMTGACLQMVGLRNYVSIRGLLPDRFATIREADYQLWLRAVAKAGRLPVAQLNARLTLLLDHRKSWSNLSVYADRMNWGRSGKWSQLPMRVRPLAALADLGATRKWITIGDQKLLQFELDDVKRISALTEEELTALDALFPATPDCEPER